MLPIDAPSDYGSAAVLTAAVAVLVALPGLAFNANRGDGGRLRAALVPVPGLLLLSGIGCACWMLGIQRSPAARLLVWTPEIGAAVAILAALRRARGIAISRRWRGASPSALWVACAVSATALGCNPLPVAQEDSAGTVLPGRMVASPPDHATPYLTASCLFHGYDGRQRSDDYFGAGWSLGSRGPLVPFAVLALFEAFGSTPTDPPDFEASHWPVTDEGAYPARALGWLSNALVVLGAAHLLTVLGAKPSALRWGVAWTALAPGMVINTVFLWPKLLSAFFVLLATASVVETGWAMAGLWMALGWLSHPVAALFLPGLGFWMIGQTLRGRVGTREKLSRSAKAVLLFGVPFSTLMLPWIAFKVSLGIHDQFLDYLLADGSVPNVAKSVGSWLEVRALNLYYTLVPCAFQASGLMRGWTDGPVPDPLHWTIGYAKTLPGELGYSQYPFACFALLRPAPSETLSRLRSFAVLIPLVVMLVCWGYSSDGLGRNALEPLVPLAIVFTAASVRPPTWAVTVTLACAWLEVLWVDLSGMVWAPGFEWSAVPPAAWLSWSVAAGVGALAVAWTRAGRDGLPTSYRPGEDAGVPDRRA